MLSLDEGDLIVAEYVDLDDGEGGAGVLRQVASHVSAARSEVDQHEAALKQHGKEYDFHMYEGAGHGFFYYDRTAYRQEQAVDGWKKIWAFLENLS